MVTKKFVPNYKVTESIESRLKTIDIVNRQNSSVIDESIVLNKKSDEELLRYLNARKDSLTMPITKESIQLLNGMINNKISCYNVDSAYVKSLKDGKNCTYASPIFSGHYVDGLLAWFDVEGPSIIVAAIFHYEFVKIHPFDDGNGRTVRLLTSLILRQSGLSSSIAFALERYFEKNHRAYKEALSFGKAEYNNERDFYIQQYDVSKEEDITPWIEYFCSAICEAISVS